MKRLIQVFFAATVVFFLAVSCSKRPTYLVIDGIGACGNGIHDRGELGVDCGGSCPNQCTNVKFLEGEIYTRVPLNPNFQYIVTGPFIIRDKAALNIPAGTKIKVQPDVGAYIAVMQGGRIFAWGTADNPITITSNAAEPRPGDWGGIIICGKAPVAGDDKRLSELGYYFYGGDNVLDSSGYLKYVKIEYAGAAYDTIRKFNAISFYGTGAYTSVDHLWIDQSQATGIGINGGTVPLTDVYVSEGEEGVRIQETWAGKGERWFLADNENQGLTIIGTPALSATNSSSIRLNHIEIKNPGSYGMYFSGVSQKLQLYNARIENAAVGIGFFNVENQNVLLNTFNFKNIGIRNSQSLSNIPQFNLMLNTAETPAAESLQRPNWATLWPQD